MRINGLNVNAAALGQGMYDIICERGDEHIVAYGMIPQWSIDLLRPALRDKIIAEAAKNLGCAVADVQPHLDEEAITKTMREIEHGVVLGIYSAAAKVGRMVV